MRLHPPTFGSIIITDFGGQAEGDPELVEDESNPREKPHYCLLRRPESSGRRPDARMTMNILDYIPSFNFPTNV